MVDLRYGASSMRRTRRILCVGAIIVVFSSVVGCSSSSATEQTTTTFGPTTTIDLERNNASWALTGSWLIHDPGVADADIRGFAVFTVDPFNVDRRVVSTGYGQCFLFSGRAVERDGAMHVVPIEGLGGGVECDPGRAADTYSRVVECLRAGCRVESAGDVLRLSTGAGEHVADLIRTTDEIPPR